MIQNSAVLHSVDFVPLVFALFVFQCYKRLSKLTKIHRLTIGNLRDNSGCCRFESRHWIRNSVGLHFEQFVPLVFALFVFHCYKKQNKVTKIHKLTIGNLRDNSAYCRFEFRHLIRNSVCLHFEHFVPLVFALFVFHCHKRLNTVTKNHNLTIGNLWEDLLWWSLL